MMKLTEEQFDKIINTVWALLESDPPPKKETTKYAIEQILTPAAPPRSAEGNTIENAKDFLDEKFMGMERDEAWFESWSKVLVAYASQFRKEVTDEEIEAESDKYGFRVPYDGSNNFYDKLAIKAFIDGAKWMREKMKGK